MATRKTTRQSARTTSNRAGIPMPSSIPPSMQGEFDELIDHLAARHGGIVPVEDLHLVENILFHRYSLRQMFEDVRVNGPVIDGKHNPAASGMPTHSGAVVKLSSALALGPSHRARLKTPPAQDQKATPSPWDDAQ